MSQAASDLLGLRQDRPQSLELRRLAAALISAGCQSELGGC